MTRFFINRKEVSRDELSNIEIRSEEIKSFLSKCLTSKIKGGNNHATFWFLSFQGDYPRKNFIDKH